MVSAFQVGVSSAKKRSYSVGERGLPGVEAEIESWAGAGGRSRSSTAGQGNRPNSNTGLGFLDRPTGKRTPWKSASGGGGGGRVRGGGGVSPEIPADQGDEIPGAEANV